MKHLLLTTIAAVVLVGTAFADPIHDAAKAGDLAGVQAELDKGVDVNAEGEFRFTPLHNAALNGHKEVVELLIAKGADVNAKMAGFMTARGGDTPLHFAAWKGHREIAELLLASGVDVNVTDNDERTPLHRVTEGGHKEIAELLIDNGADVNAKANAGLWKGFTPLHQAASRGRKEIAELLVAAGADVSAKEDTRGRTPLHHAATKEVAELLIAAGADVNAKANNGKTPLDGAYNRETADLFRKHGGRTAKELALMPQLSFIRSPFGFTFNTIEEKTYRVESGMDLKKWNKLREIKGTGNEAKFIDVRRIYFPQHFYRVLVVD